MTYLIQHGFTYIDLTGHTDSQGLSNGYDNQKLSVERAKIVEKYLMSKLSNHNVTILSEAKAHVDPIASNKTGNGQAANRRVEIQVK